MTVLKNRSQQTHYIVAVIYSQNKLHIAAVIKIATRKTVSIPWFFGSVTSHIRKLCDFCGGKFFAFLSHIEKLMSQSI